MAEATPVGAQPAIEHKQLTGAFALFSKSKALVMNNLKLFIILNIFSILGAFSSMFPKTETTGTGQTTGTEVSGSIILTILGVGAVIFIVLLVLAMFWAALLFCLQHEAALGKKPTFSSILDIAKKYWLRLFGLQVVVAIMVAVGLLLFIVPGLILIRRYFLSPYVLIDKDLSIGEAMKQSAAMSKPYSGAIWGVVGVIVLISLIGIIPVIGGLISTALAILYSVAPALRYQEIKAAAHL